MNPPPNLRGRTHSAVDIFLFDFRHLSFYQDEIIQDFVLDIFIYHSLPCNFTTFVYISQIFHLVLFKSQNGTMLYVYSYLLWLINIMFLKIHSYRYVIVVNFSQRCVWIVWLLPQCISSRQTFFPPFLLVLQICSYLCFQAFSYNSEF